MRVTRRRVLRRQRRSMSFVASMSWSDTRGVSVFPWTRRRMSAKAIVSLSSVPPIRASAASPP
jgi:hypothetical protein